MTEEEIEALAGRECHVVGVLLHEDDPNKPGTPIFKILDAWEDDGDVRILLKPPCVDGGTTRETVSYDEIYFPTPKE